MVGEELVGFKEEENWHWDSFIRSFGAAMTKNGGSFTSSAVGIPYGAPVSSTLGLATAKWTQTHMEA